MNDSTYIKYRKQANHKYVFRGICSGHETKMKSKEVISIKKKSRDNFTFGEARGIVVERRARTSGAADRLFLNLGGGYADIHFMIKHLCFGAPFYWISYSIIHR